MLINLNVSSFQLTTIRVTDDESQVELLPSDEPALQGIKEVRIVFVNVTGADSVTLELHVLGCIKG